MLKKMNNKELIKMKITKYILLIILFTITIIDLFGQQQIKFKNNKMRIIIEENVPIYSEMKKGSRIIATIDNCHKIILLKTTDSTVIINNIRGHWIYIDARVFKKGSLAETVKGWTLDYYLADLKDFKKIDKFCTGKIEGSVSDWGLDIEFQKNGRFKRKHYNSDTEKYEYSEGFVYRYRNVFCAYDDDGKGWEFFYLKNNRLCHPSLSTDNKPMCIEKCEF